KTPFEQAVKFFASDREVFRAKSQAGHDLGQKNRATLQTPFCPWVACPRRANCQTSSAEDESLCPRVCIDSPLADAHQVPINLRTKCASTRASNDHQMPTTRQKTAEAAEKTLRNAEDRSLRALRMLRAHCGLEFDRYYAIFVNSFHAM